MRKCETDRQGEGQRKSHRDADRHEERDRAGDREREGKRERKRERERQRERERERGLGIERHGDIEKGGDRESDSKLDQTSLRNTPQPRTSKVRHARQNSSHLSSRCPSRRPSCNGAKIRLALVAPIGLGKSIPKVKRIACSFKP